MGVRPRSAFCPTISNWNCPARNVCLSWAIKQDWPGLSCARCSYKKTDSILLLEDYLLRSPDLEGYIDLEDLAFGL